MKMTTGGVTSATGFMAAGYGAGIKYQGRKDMAMIYSSMPCSVAGVFTSNVVKAAPVLWDQKIVQESAPVYAVVINSGIANACTGRDGYEICKKTAEETGKVLGVPENGVLIGSTGVIGMQIPFDKIVNGIDQLKTALSANQDAGTQAAEAIMTTDTHSKQLLVTFTLDGKECHIGAMAKGSGMIHPNMCTMLCFVTTDVSISQQLLQKALSRVVTDTFNMISVDGDMSTNDSLMILANGCAHNTEITQENTDYEIFFTALEMLCTEMAKMLAGDGEGATALFEAHVTHADTKHNARVLSKSVICSNLTKAAIYGHDANWGRILCALGYSGVMFDPDKIDLYIQSTAGKLLLYHDGQQAEYSEKTASGILSQSSVTALVDMHMGEEEATAWGCDLTYEYVKINADYRS